MIDQKVWFVTGASRGVGVDIVKAALAAGHSVVTTGRDANAVASAVGAIDDYAQNTRATVDAWRAMNGLQGGDPVKLAKALIQLVGTAEPPVRWPAGADAVEALEQKARVLESQANAHRELSMSLGHTR